MRIDKSRNLNNIPVFRGNETEQKSDVQECTCTDEELQQKASKGIGSYVKALFNIRQKSKTDKTTEEPEFEIKEKLTKREFNKILEEIKKDPDYYKLHKDQFWGDININKYNVQLTKYVLSKKELLDNENFAKKIGDFVRYLGTKNEADTAVLMINEIDNIRQNNPDLWNNENLKKHIINIVYNINTTEQFDSVKDSLTLKTFNTVSNLEKNCLSHPDKYINGEMSEEDSKEFVQGFFENNFVNLLIASDAFDAKTMNVLLRKRFNDAFEYLDKLCEFNKDELKLLKAMSNCTNNDDKPFLESQKIDFITLLDSYKNCNISTDIIKDMVKTGKVDLGKINLNLLENMMKKSGYSDKEVENIPKEKLMSWDMDHIHLLLAEFNKQDNDEEDIQTFKDLIKSANSEDFEKYISYTSNVYGKANEKTKSMYDEMGMNYDKWIHPDKSHNIQFVAKDENLKKLEQVAKQVEEDMNNLMNTNAKGFLKKQLGEKFFKEDKFKLPEEYTTNKNKLSELVEQLSDDSDKGVLTKMWKRAKGNSRNEDLKIQQNALNTLTVLSHLNQRKEDISKISDIQSKKTLNWTIKMWDRNPQKDIFQGNYSTCCIGMGEINSESMPHYIMDTAFNMIELVNETGKTTGNALCYFVKDYKGDPAFIIDNIEINDSVKPDTESKTSKQIRDAIAEYASLIAKDVTGKDNIPIYLSSQNNDVSIKDLSGIEKNVSFIGTVDSNARKIYMDLYKGWINTDKLAKNVELLKIR